MQWIGRDMRCGREKFASTCGRGKSCAGSESYSILVACGGPIGGDWLPNTPDPWSKDRRLKSLLRLPKREIGGILNPFLDPRATRVNHQKSGSI